MNKVSKEEPTTPCCHECIAPTVKYYSVDTNADHCGETCIKPSLFWIYKIFEPALALDNDSNTPCADRNYTFYQYTPTHGVWPLLATLDLYDEKPRP